jgi:selenocysteine lyase/cysteine desulfurase
MHEQGGLCFIDFAAAAPYVNINMHPEDLLAKIEGVFFSPHKFLGGPGTSGVLIFDSHLYKLRVPDQPGGGTVDWTNPWGGHKYIADIEFREDGGTPGFLQAIKSALTINLKEQMDVNLISEREHELKEIIFNRLENISSLHILAHNITERLGFFSFYVEDTHYNLIVKLLNDRYGIQVRGGCSCAGTYGHYLLHVLRSKSKRITDKINSGDLSEKPGWVRFSAHPTMTNDEADYLLNAIEEIVLNVKEWKEDYNYSPKTNDFYNKSDNQAFSCFNKDWFTL